MANVVIQSNNITISNLALVSESKMEIYRATIRIFIT
jgi:hypothetical protein